MYVLYGNNILGPNVEIPQDYGVKLVDDRETACIIPQEPKGRELTEDSDHVIGAMLHDQYAMYTAREYLNGAR